MSQLIEKRRGHFGVSEDLHQFSEGGVGGDNQRGLFVEFADQMEEQVLRLSLSEKERG